jgi:hypothetical protein
MKIISERDSYVLLIPGATEEEICIAFDNHKLCAADDVRLSLKGNLVARLRRGQAKLFCIAFAREVLKYV